MKKNTRKRSAQTLIQRYRNLPSALKSRSAAERNRAQKLLALTICIPLMLWGLGYMISWEVTRIRIERENAAIRALYTAQSTLPAESSAATAAPLFTPVPTPELSAEPTPTATAQATSAPTPASTAQATSAPTPAPTATAQATSAPTPAPTAQATPAGQDFEIAVDATIRPVSTPDADTIVYAMETPPPEQFAFGDLLALNPETVGFLRIGDKISLPVVQRPNDNQYYLNHSFNCEESIAGTLFLDGANLLVPEDQNLIIYGHNMRNGTMFRPLINYESLTFLKEHALVRFDTIYQNRNYVPFAVFSVTADEGSERYMNIRQFMFDQGSWEKFIGDIQALSMHNIPVDIQFGDQVLLLVTCEYTHNNGRFVVALRAQRQSESDDELRARVQAAY